jgi:hypothetical protein
MEASIAGIEAPLDVDYEAFGCAAAQDRWAPVVVAEPLQRSQGTLSGLARAPSIPGLSQSCLA